MIENILDGTLRLAKILLLLNTDLRTLTRIYRQCCIVVVLTKMQCKKF